MIFILLIPPILFAANNDWSDICSEYVDYDSQVFLASDWRVYDNQLGSELSNSCNQGWFMYKLNLTSQYFFDDKEITNLKQRFKKTYGLCTGMTTLWLLSKWQRFAESNSNIYSWKFEEIIGSIAIWDGRRGLSAKEIADIENFALLVDFFQYLPFVDLAQNDIETGISLKGLDLITGNFKKKYTIAAKFTTAQQIIDLLLAIIKEDELVLIVDEVHTTGLFKHDGIYYFYDSNEDYYEYQETFVEKIGKKIFDLINSDGKNGVMGITIFSNLDMQENLYPKQKDLLSKINKDVDRRVLLEGAIEAAAIGCMESLSFYMDKGIDPNEKNEFGDSVFGMAVIFNQVSIVKHLLKNGANLDQKINYQPHPLAHECFVTGYDLSMKVGYTVMANILRNK